MKIEGLDGIITFFKRFHTLIFFLLVSIGLFVAILTIISTVSKSSETPAESQAVNGTFDEQTVERIKTSSEPAEPGARTSPFVE